MTENPANIRREIEIAEDAWLAAVVSSADDDVVAALSAEHGRHIYQLHLRLARAELDPTNQQRT